MSEIDIFVSPTGVITVDHMKKLKHIAFVGNTGHFDNEIDFAAQRAWTSSLIVSSFPASGAG